jgi:hypothetical protein
VGDYRSEQHKVYTSEGVRALLRIYATAEEADKTTGSCTTFALLRRANVGETWLGLNAIDVLVSCNILRKVGEGSRSDDLVFVFRPPSLLP